MKALGFTRYRKPEGADRPRGYVREGCEYGKPVPLKLPPKPTTAPSVAATLSREPGEDDDVPF